MSSNVTKLTLSTASQSSFLPLDPASTAIIPIILSIRQISPAHPQSAITAAAIRNVFDLSNILDIRVLALTNIESGQSIKLHTAVYSPTVRPNIKFTWGHDIRDSIDFVSIPSMRSNESLTLTFDLSVQRLRNMWARRFLRKSSASASEFPFTSPGSWRLQFVSENSVGFHRNGIVLWTWGHLDDELQGKKFEYPAETRYPFDLEAEKTMKEERKDGKYVQVHPNDTAEVEYFVCVETVADGIAVNFEH